MTEEGSNFVGISRLEGDDGGPSQESDGSLNSDPPATPTEIKLAGIWSSVLPQTQICREDNFIVLGGDSLSLAQVITEVEENFQVLLPIEVIANNMTLKGMAEVLDQLVADGKNQR